MNSVRGASRRRTLSAGLVTACAVVAGVMAPLTAQASMIPSANLKYWGGLVYQGPAIALIYWGQWWHEYGEHQSDIKNYMKDYFSGIGTPRDNWSPVVTQYGDTLGNRPQLGTTRGVYSAKLVWTDSSNPPRIATTADIANEVAKYAEKLLPSKPQSVSLPIFYVLSPPWAHPEGFGLKGSDLCARHDSAYASNAAGIYYRVPFVNLPDYLGSSLVKQLTCFGYSDLPSIRTTPKALDAFSVNAGHELAEVLTDPWDTLTACPGCKLTFPDVAWASSMRGKPDLEAEIADKCEGQIFAEHLPSGWFAQQKLWDNETGKCQKAVYGRIPLRR